MIGFSKADHRIQFNQFAGFEVKGVDVVGEGNTGAASGDGVTTFFFMPSSKWLMMYS